MSRKIAIQILQEKGKITIPAQGNSMRPLIANKDSIHLIKVHHSKLKVGDAIFCKIKGGLVVHKISAINEPNERYQISNNFGHINGTINKDNIYGLCVAVNDRIIISEKELDNR